MNSNPLVSVIIIFLNAGSFLREAIESVLAQTYHNWELLLVDDGSNDASSGMAREYAEQNPKKVRYLEHFGHRNRGSSASRNLGLSNAKGDYIAFLDADDAWLPAKLGTQVAFMEQNSDVEVLINPAFIWKDGTKTPQRLALPTGRLSRGAWLITLLGCDGSDAFPSAAILRKDFAVRVQGFDECVRQLYEDQVLWVKASLNATVYHDDRECLTLYRVHSDSSCVSTPRLEYLYLEISFYKWVVQYLKQHSFPGFEPRLPIVMARCKIANALIRLEYLAANNRFGRLRKGLELMREHAGSLGCFFPGLLLLGSISQQTAFAVAEGIFVFSRVTYSERLRKSVQVIPRYLLQVLRSMIPDSIKRSVKQISKLGFSTKHPA